MTVECADCHVNMGEKCSACGVFAEKYNAITVDGRIWCFCETCADYFLTGEGGTSHGLCERCLQQARNQLKRLEV